MKTMVAMADKQQLREAMILTFAAFLVGITVFVYAAAHSVDALFRLWGDIRDTEGLFLHILRHGKEQCNGSPTV
jgi:hypothetical protein